MKTKVDFGIRIPVSGPLSSTEHIIKSTNDAESMGFDTIWVHDQLIWSQEQNSHHVSSGAIEAVVPGRNPDFFESISTLSYLAGITNKIKLGVAVVVLPLRNPVVLAKQLMNVDVFSRGRLLLGVGAGAPLVGKTFQSVGVPFEKRGEITDDYLQALITIFHQEPKSTYNGKYTSFTEVDIFPKTLQKPHPPIIVGGMGRALRRSAEFGDGWIPANIRAEDVRPGIEKIKVMAAKRGRTIDNFIVGNEIFASVAKDSESARKNAAATIASYAKSIGRGSEEVTLVGSTSEVSKKIEKYIESGINMFELKFIYKDMDSFAAQMKLFSSEIMPSFR